MSADHPGRWWVHHAKTAIAELPENAGWLMRRYLTPPPVERAVDEARSGARRMSESIADAVPFGGDSLDLRLHRAREALEDAQRAEQQALRRMREANDLAEREKAVTAAGRQGLQEAKRAAAAATKRRVAEARERADAMVAEERAAAEADASGHVDEVAAQAEAEREEAARRAEEAHERAEAEMAAAQEQLAHARALADEAAEAARAAADEAHRRARAMTEQAEAQSRAADERATEADRARGSVVDQTAEFVREADAAPAAEDIADRTKAELLDLAASLEIDGRSAMTKDELVQAVRKASNATAVHGRAGGRLMAAARKRSLWRRALLAGAGALRRPQRRRTPPRSTAARRPPDGRRHEAVAQPARAARRGRGARRDVGQRGRVLPEASRGAVTRARP